MYCLDIEKSKNKKLCILKKIAIHLSDLNIFIKDKILKKYYVHFQSLKEVNSRNNLRIFMKEEYKYLDSKDNGKRFKSIIMKKIKEKY